MRNLLLAEELALVAIDPDSGRHALGTRTQLNACLAGLFVAELVLDGHARRGDGEHTLVLEAGAPPRSPTMAAVARVLDDKGPKIKAVLSHMDRGLGRELGHGTWDAAVLGLVEARAVKPADGALRSHRVIDRVRRTAIVTALRRAAATDGSLPPRTALLLAMTGPANLLEVVAPERRRRHQARRRIDHALDGSPFEPIGKTVHKLITEAQAAAAG